MASNVTNLDKYWNHSVKKSKWLPLTNTWPEGTEFQFWDSRRDTEMLHQITWYGGIDIHQKKLTIGIYGIHSMQSPQRILGPIIDLPVSDQGFLDLFQVFDYFQLKRIVMETTGVYSFEPYYQCRERYPPINGEVRVICMNAHDLKKLLVVNKKTDKVDTSRLAFLASVPELLRESYIPTREEYIMRLMLRYRNKYQNEATKYKNRIKTLFAAGGFRWQFNFDNKEHVHFIKRFIDQPLSLGRFLDELMLDPISSGEMQKILQKDQKELRQWAKYQITPLEHLNLNLLIGMNEKSEGMVKMFDKLIYEQMHMLSRYQNQIDLIQHFPSLGEWSLATIILETGPICRFPSVGAYLSYTGLTTCVAESADVKVKMGNNPHSHRILKQAYRAAAMSILGITIRAEKGLIDSNFQTVHPILEYAHRINKMAITNGQKANKIAAKMARMIYGILRSKIAYDPNHSRKQDQVSLEWNQKNRLVLRYSALQRQIGLLNTTYNELVSNYSLNQEPFIEKFIQDCQNVCSSIDRDQLINHLRFQSKTIRDLKTNQEKNNLRRKKTTKKALLIAKGGSSFDLNDNGERNEE